MITRLEACLFLSAPGQESALLPEPWTLAPFPTLERRKAFLEQEGIPLDPRLGWTYSLPFSSPLEESAWLAYIQTPPQVFLRLQQNEKRSRAALDQAGIPWKALDHRTLALDRATPVDRILPPEDYRIQDASSQACGEAFAPRPGEKWWDCCCGAGGKSMLLLDKEKAVELWVSDSRKKAIQSLKKRWSSSPYPLPHRILTGTVARLVQEEDMPLFDHIIADLPCTGSGTWARNPEQFAFFSDRALPAYQQKQQAISRKAAAQLKPGGILYYITCSVFREENEEGVKKLTDEGLLTLIDQKMVHRAPYASDHLFLARLRKPTN